VSVGDRTFPTWSFRNPLRRATAKPGRLLDFCGPATGETVADLGAGAGYFLEELRRRVGPSGRVYQVDIDPRALAAAQRLAESPEVAAPVEFVHASAASVPAIASSSVDYVLANGLLCCLVDKEGAVGEIWRILRPGGRALVTFQTLSRGWTARGRALRLTDARFADLIGAQPWIVVAGRRSLFRRAYRLTKPPAASSPTGGR
jgi:ubiquinone/menaquinone biosynthesis C-methylase UbiE